MNPKLPRLTTSFYYLAFRDGLPTVAEFAKFLKHEIVNFCIPYSRRAKTAERAQANQKDARRLFVDEYEKARSLFIQASNELDRGGECGELILYLILEAIFGAPQVVSKMFLKTSGNMPVHGADGIHVSLDQSGVLTFFLGESKGYAELSSALDDALTSIEHLRQAGPTQREIDILRDHMEVGQNPNLRDELVKYFDPYEPKANSRKDSHALLIGFTYRPYEALSKLPPAEAEARFSELYRRRCVSAIKLLEKKLVQRKMQHINIDANFIGVPSIANLRSAFHDEINYGT